MHILKIDSSFLEAHSASRELTAAIVAALASHHRDATITYRDLAGEDVPHVSTTALPSVHPAALPDDALTADGLAARRTSDAMLQEFLAADIVVIGAPMYNFFIPSQLKAWIDRIVIPGTTVRYTADGPEGAAGGKKIVVAIARGGVYPRDGSGPFPDYAEDYLRTIFRFLGIDDMSFIVAEGLSMGEAARAEALADAHAAIARLSGS